MNLAASRIAAAAGAQLYRWPIQRGEFADLGVTDVGA